MMLDPGSCRIAKRSIIDFRRVNHNMNFSFLQIAACKAQGKSVPSSLTQKLEKCTAQMQEAQAILKTGGNTGKHFGMSPLHISIGARFLILLQTSFVNKNSSTQVL